jgi:uncharacterized protein YbcV (DUF1398 family)
VRKNENFGKIMNANQITYIVHNSAKLKMPFPEVVGKLIDAGVEYYHVNYITLQHSFYSSEGAVVIVPLPFENFCSVAKDFDAAALKAAIYDSQNNNQPYRQFSERAAQAGVQSYFVFLRGQRVVYIGRQGEQHTEWFLGANT